MGIWENLKWKRGCLDWGRDKMREDEMSGGDEELGKYEEE